MFEESCQQLQKSLLIPKSTTINFNSNGSYCKTDPTPHTAFLVTDKKRRIKSMEWHF